MTDGAKACPGTRQKTIHLLRQLADMVDEESKKLRNEVTNRNEVEFGEAKSRLGGDKSGVMKSRIADIRMSKESTKS